jgi:hypothetical protein
MMRSRWRWLLGNVVVALGAPIVFGLGIRHEVEREYAEGLRVATDGDSVGIPIGAFAILLWATLLTLNGGVFIVRWIQARRRVR